MSTTTDPIRDRIVRATVTLLITRGLGGLDIEAVCTAADVDRPVFDQHFSSVDSVYVGIVAGLLDVHVDNPDGAVAAAPPLDEALRSAMGAVWSLLEARIDDHHALHVLFLGQIADPGLLDRMGFSLHETHVRVAEQWLRTVRVTHGVAWDTPVELLAVLVQATIDGVMMDYLSRRDGTRAREVLDIFAGHLAHSAILA